MARTPIAQLRAGDTVAVHTGEKIAVDGVIASGVAVIDQSAITGEFVPVEKRAGDEVFAGLSLIHICMRPGMLARTSRIPLKEGNFIKLCCGSFGADRARTPSTAAAVKP